MTIYEQWLLHAENIAREAGALIQKRWRHTHTVRAKGFRDVVTETDLAAERIILGRLRELFPTHAITSEEAGADQENRQVRWLIDPLDGTTNFSRNNPNFCISIAAISDGEPVVGVVYDPLREQLFSARRGGGATLNGESCRTSGLTNLADAVFAADWPRDPQLRAEHWQQVTQLMSSARTLRGLGSAALNIVYVASGWFDLYLARRLSAWDQTAAALIVCAAGGAAGTLSGAPWNPYVLDPVLAATPELLAEFQRQQPQGLNA
ncbi:MAG: inositol monophosphatase family protein [Chloroflexota bacterium]|nr:inositol monophosphatase family protein [Chloroflexota bacterium]